MQPFNHRLARLLGTGLLLGSPLLTWAQEELPPAAPAAAPAIAAAAVAGAEDVEETDGADVLPAPDDAAADCDDAHRAALELSSSRISDEVIGIQPVPDRPHLVVEKGDRFLGTGFFRQGCQLPTGAVWRPSLWVFGQNRLAFQYFDNQSSINTTELVDRLDLFAQLNLTGTERLVFGVRPLDHEVHNQRRYTSYDFTDGRYVDGLNFYPQTLFFEGDFGEIFPNCDPFDTKSIDYGFSIGRQPVYFQDGMLINADILDAITVTRNTLYGHGVLNSRITLMYAWDRVHRNDDLTFYLVDTKAHLFGVFTETDFKFSTVNADLVYVYTSNPTTQDGIYFGLSGTQRLPLGNQLVNNTARVVGSFPTETETLATGKGVVLFNQFSITPKGTEDLIYANMFWALGNYTSAARGVEMGGPLSPAGGLLFAKPQIGVFGSPLDNLTDDVIGGALGYQLMWDGIRKQLTFEVGGRQDTNGANNAQIGLGVLYQQAIGQHHIFLFNAAVAKEEGVGALPTGARIEWLTKF